MKKTRKARCIKCFKLRMIINYCHIFSFSSLSGGEAKRVFDDAQKLLSKIIAEGSLKANGIVGFYPANSVDDDIELYSDESRSQVLGKCLGLRQQVR